MLRKLDSLADPILKKASKLPKSSAADMLPILSVLNDVTNTNDMEAAGENIWCLYLYLVLLHCYINTLIEKCHAAGFYIIILFLCGFIFLFIDILTKLARDYTLSLVCAKSSVCY